MRISARLRALVVLGAIGSIGAEAAASFGVDRTKYNVTEGTATVRSRANSGTSVAARRDENEKNAREAALKEGVPAALLTPEVQTRLGLKCDPISADPAQGLVIKELVPDSDALRAGLQLEDKILDARRIEDRLEMSIMRANQTMLIRIPLSVLNGINISGLFPNEPADLSHARTGSDSLRLTRPQMSDGNGTARGANVATPNSSSTNPPGTTYGVNSLNGPNVGNVSGAGDANFARSGGNIGAPGGNGANANSSAGTGVPAQAVPLRVEQFSSGLGAQGTGFPPLAPPFARFDNGVRASSRSFPLSAAKSAVAANTQTVPLNAQKTNLAAATAQPAFPLNAQRANLSGSANKPPLLVGRAQTGVRVLQNYNVELIIDASNSMHRVDTPNGSSRWDWCGMQAQNLANQVSSFLPQGLTITTFAGQYDVYEHASPQRIATIFSRQGLSRGTRLAEPLQERLNNYFSRRTPASKPLLICIITDGVPWPPREPQMCADVIIDATRKMRNPNEITVVFFQVGARDEPGRRFLDFMDFGLKGAGARYDIVRTVTFEELASRGLARSMSDVVRNFTQ